MTILAGLKSVQAWLAAWPQIALALLLTVPASFLLGQCSGVSSERAVQQSKSLAATVEAMNVNVGAHDEAAAEREIDREDVADHKEKNLDAISKAPSSAPDAAGVALGCQRLRNAGRNEGSLPLPCRSQGQAKAKGN